MMPSDTAATLASYVRSAVRLKAETAPFQSDLAVAPERIVYCVDANCVWLFVSPKTMAPRRSDGGGGYGSVFDDEKPQLSEAVGAALAHYVFYCLNDLPDGRIRPLILLPGHDAETRRLYDRLAKEVADPAAKADRELQALDRILRAVRSMDPERAERHLVNYRKHLVQYLHLTDTPRAKMRRLNALLADERLARLEVAAAEMVTSLPDQDEAAVLLRAFEGPSNLRERLVEGFFRREWERRLKRERPERDDAAVTADVAALARLEWVNERLAEVDLRMVLITGDEAILRAGEAYVRPSDADRTFAESFLRHPRAFLAASETFGAAPNETGSRLGGLADGWLDTFLARFLDGRQGVLRSKRKFEADPRSLEKSASDVLTVDRGAAEVFKRQWERYAENVSRHLLSSLVASDERRSLLGDDLGGAAVEGFAGLNDHLLKEREQRSLGFFEAVTRTGYDLLAVDDSPRHLRKRMPPTVSFDSFAATERFVRLVMSEGLSGLEPRGLDSHCRDIEEEDPSGYAKLLAYAVLFAHAGRWHVAQIIARQAIAVVSRRATLDRGGADGRISGREAFYFAAVAQRYLARNPADLDAVEPLLAEAAARLENDRGRHSPSTVSDIRFRAESLSLSLTRLLHARFASRRIAPLRSDLLDGLIESFARLDEEARKENDVWVAANVGRSALTNLFMTIALRFNGDVSPGNATGPVRDLPDRADRLAATEEAGGPHTLPRTELTMFVGLFAKIVSRPRSSSDEMLRREFFICEAYLAEIGRKEQFTPYDRSRYLYLMALSRELLRMPTSAK